MKKLTALILSLVLIAGCLPLSVSAASAPFADVYMGEYYYNAVQWAAEKGIVNGMTETTFEPETPCTRGQAVTMLWRHAGSPAPASGSCPFTDVAAGQYYENAVRWAAEKGIVRGMTEHTFEPEALCTRGQIALLLWRAEEAPAPASAGHFTDVPADACYADAVRWAEEKHIAFGMTETTFEPETPCTRGQIATFLYRSTGSARETEPLLKEDCYEKEGSYRYRMPRLTADTAGAREINGEIDRCFGTKIRQGMEDDRNGVSAEPCLVDWSAHRYENVLVLLVWMDYAGDCREHQVYCMDLTDGSRITNRDILAMYGLSESEFTAAARKTAEAAFYQYNPEEHCSWSGPEFEEALRRTLSEERINTDMGIYPAADGTLMLIIDVANLVAGASSFERLCPGQLS